MLHLVAAPTVSLVPEAGASPIDLEPVLGATQVDLVRSGDDWGITWIVGEKRVRWRFTRITAAALAEALGSDPELGDVVSCIEGRLIAYGFEVTRLDARAANWTQSPTSPAAWDLKRPATAASR